MDGQIYQSNEWINGIKQMDRLLLMNTNFSLPRQSSQHTDYQHLDAKWADKYIKWTHKRIKTDR